MCLSVLESFQDRLQNRIEQKEKIITMKKLPGITLCLGIAMPAWLVGSSFPLIGSPVLGILLGMMIARLCAGFLTDQHRSHFDCGIKYASKKLLQYSIILLGFEMDLMNVLRIGKQSLFIILFTLSASFITAFIVGKFLGLEGKMTALIGVGTSICGGSAIAATAPVIQAEDKDVSQAISTIFLFNIAAVFIFPVLGQALGMSDIGFGMWAGTAINDTSSVVAAGAAWSNISGNNTALAFATVVKLTRTLMIVPITLVLAFYMMKQKRNTDFEVKFKFRDIFPWFVLAFIAATVLNTLLGVPDLLSQIIVSIGKFGIVMAMAGVGLNTDIHKLLTNGGKPILLGLCCWFSVAGVSLLIQQLLGLW